MHWITADLVDHPVHHLALDSELLEHLVEGVCVLLLHTRETSLLLAFACSKGKYHNVNRLARIHYNICILIVIYLLPM